MRYVLCWAHLLIPWSCKYLPLVHPDLCFWAGSLASWVTHLSPISFSFWGQSKGSPNRKRKKARYFYHWIPPSEITLDWLRPLTGHCSFRGGLLRPWPAVQISVSSLLTMTLLWQWGPCCCCEFWSLYHPLWVTTSSWNWSPCKSSLFELSSF